MEERAPDVFLDVPLLLEVSLPQPRVPWVWLTIGFATAMLLVSSFSDQPALRAAAAVMGGGLLIGFPFMIRASMRKIAGEQRGLRDIAEMVQLRRWPQAVAALRMFLGRPARLMQFRSEALIYLGAVLARYHRFDDAIAVYTYLIDNDLLSPSTAFAIKLGRTMAMLREDHLFDADRAISDLRRAGGADVAGLALVEMYRDVKTGHSADALRLFEDKLPLLRQQLGHRLADAHALAARAYDLLGRQDEARDAFGRATLLAPLIELTRRYPEVEKLVGRYQPAPAPPEMA